MMCTLKLRCLSNTFTFAFRKSPPRLSLKEFEMLVVETRHDDIIVVARRLIRHRIVVQCGWLVSNFSKFLPQSLKISSQHDLGLE